MTNKTVLITGAAVRLGAAIARYLHVRDCDLVIHYYKSRNEAQQLVDGLNHARPDSAWAIQADLLESGRYRQLVDEALSCNGRLDVLINNASAFYPTPIADADTATWEEIVGTNLRAPFFLTQHAAPSLRKHSGCVINITDIHGLRPLRGYPVYSIAKAGLIMLTKALAKELAPEIRVNAVSPGAIIWPRDMASERQQKIIARTALKRQGTAADVAASVWHLMEAVYVTGQVLSVDGGRTLYS